MKQESWLCARAMPNFISQDYSVECIVEPFSEEVILELQNKFLSNGIQHIKVLDVESGRLLVQSFLNSMRAHHAIACLTMAKKVPDPAVINIYDEYVNNSSLEAFFFDSPLVDFMWIELTDAIQLQSWFSVFQERLFESRLDEQIPIILVSYQQESLALM